MHRLTQIWAHGGAPLRTIIFVMLVLALAIPVMAQDAPHPGSDGVITDDEVNAIAKDLYCPVCENIPLDTCGTAACDDWRYEIRLQLEAGMTEQQIVDDFVTRFGDRVVGTPQDPILRAMSLVVPWAATILALAAVIYMFLNWRGDDRDEPPAPPDEPNDLYRSLLERDVAS